MSLRHLLTGTMVGVFALALSADPSRPMDSAAPEAIAADKAPSGGGAGSSDAKIASKSDDKQPERAAERTARDGSAKNDKPATTWAQRLVFPSGNKF